MSVDVVAESVLSSRHAPKKLGGAGDRLGDYLCVDYARFALGNVSETKYPNKNVTRLNT